MISVLVAAGVLATAGIVVWFVIREPADSADQAPQPSAKRTTDDEGGKITTKRGPRPEMTRLRDGAKQVEEKEQALSMAREALERVESELESLDDDSKRPALERRKQLIEKSIALLCSH